MNSVVFVVLFFFVTDLVFYVNSSDCSQTQCVQGFNPLDCPDGTLYQDNVAMGGCCPACVRFRGDGEPCSGEISQQQFDITKYYTSKTYITTGRPPVVARDLCAPGLECKDGQCSITDSYGKCPAEDENPKWTPACDVDGTYKPVQCKTDGPDQRCFCYSKEGKRIFGLDWYENRDKMKCLCSRQAEELRKDPANRDMTFHCSANGNFEPLQCNRGMCYCADVYTGQPRSFLVPDALWNTLPCYNETMFGTKYLKTCDSQSNALALIVKETASHGSNPISLTAPPCDPDGSYSSKQCEGSQCYCRTRANVNIGSYFTERNSASEATQTCYCARDEVIYAAAGRSHTYLCTNGGNYNPLQILGNWAFCVDGDGFLSSEVVPVEQKCTHPSLAECTDQYICPPSN